MGSISDQKDQLATKANIKKTWEELLSKANIQEETRDKLLTYDELSDATHPVTILMVFIYQMENRCYNELNLACRYKDHSKVSSLGPWEVAMSQRVGYTQVNREKTKYDCCKEQNLWRGGGMT